ncbi:MAG: response regulator transcription factor [Saprospiraceae bacterium]|nr:response regulator transcription factor [Lewinellaceae bacterium]
MIQLAIADDEALFRKGMMALIQDWPDMHVLLDAQDGEDLLEQLRQAGNLPDVLLLDLNMPRLNGIETAKIIRETYPELKIVVLSTYFSNAFVLKMIELGAAAYLPKNSDPAEMRQTILEVVANGFSYSRPVLEIIRQNLQQKSKPKLRMPFGIELTGRELEILQLICEEYTTAEIAEKLYISPRTVDGHRNNLLEKLDCKNVAGLVVYAIQHELVRVGPDGGGFS